MDLGMDRLPAIPGALWEPLAHVWVAMSPTRPALYPEELRWAPVQGYGLGLLAPPHRGQLLHNQSIIF